MKEYIPVSGGGNSTRRRRLVGAQCSGIGGVAGWEGAGSGARTAWVCILLLPHKLSSHPQSPHVSNGDVSSSYHATFWRITCGCKAHGTAPSIYTCPVNIRVDMEHSEKEV